MTLRFAREVRSETKRIISATLKGMKLPTEMVPLNWETAPDSGCSYYSSPPETIPASSVKGTAGKAQAEVATAVSQSRQADLRTRT